LVKCKSYKALHFAVP